MEQATKLAAVVVLGLLALTLLAGGFLLVLSGSDPLLALAIVEWALSMVKWVLIGVGGAIMLACKAVGFAFKAYTEGFFGAAGEHSYQQAGAVLAWMWALMVVGLPQGRALPRTVSVKAGQARHRSIRGKHRAFKWERK